MPFPTYTELTLANQPALSVGNCTLSNGNLTVSSTPGNAQVYNDSSQNAGSYYFELDIVNAGSYYVTAVGICNVGQLGNNQAYSGNNCCVVQCDSGNVKLNGAEVFSFGEALNGKTVSICVALPNLIWFAVNGGNWNNNPSANPSVGVGGISIASALTDPVSIVINEYYGGGAVVTANFGQTAYAYPGLIPSLFGNWPPPEEIILNPVSSVTTQALSLSGTASTALTAGVDYSVDSGATWTEATGFSGSITFSAQGPSFTLPTEAAIIVRDHATTFGVSNSETFTAGNQPSGEIIFQDNFESYGDLSDAEAGGWAFSYNQTSYPAYNPIGTPAGGSSNWLCASGGGTQTNVTDCKMQHTFADLTKGRITFNFGPVSSTFDNFYNGAIYFSSMNSDQFDPDIIFQFTPAPNSDFTSYGIPVQSTTYTITVENGVHYYDIDFDLTVVPPTLNINIDGTSQYSGTVAGISAGSVINVFQVYNQNAAAMQIDNLKVFNTGAGITLVSATASYNQYVSLSGSFVNAYDPASLEYQIDGAGSWGTLTTYGSVNENWSGYGPKAQDFNPHTVQVRDTSNPGILSNTLTYAAQNGVFVWDDVTIT